MRLFVVLLCLGLAVAVAPNNPASGTGYTFTHYVDDLCGPIFAPLQDGSTLIASNGFGTANNLKMIRIPKYAGSTFDGTDTSYIIGDNNLFKTWPGSFQSNSKGHVYAIKSDTYNGCQLNTADGQCLSGRDNLFALPSESLGAISMAIEPGTDDMIVNTYKGIYRISNPDNNPIHVTLITSNLYDFDGLSVDSQGQGYGAANGVTVFSTVDGHTITNIQVPDVGNNGQPDGIAATADGSLVLVGTTLGRVILFNRTTGNNYSPIFLDTSNLVRYDWGFVGADGCMYLSHLGDNNSNGCFIIRITKADGTCNFSSAVAQGQCGADCVVASRKGCDNASAATTTGQCVSMSFDDTSSSGCFA